MTLNVQYPGENGELEPFVTANNAKFVGFLTAYQFRRNNARMSAVNYGTAHTIATPLASMTTQELSLYYNHLLERAERDEKSEELYEAMSVKRIEIETLTERLEVDDLTDGEHRKLLIGIDKALVHMQRMAEKMEKLADG